MGQDESDKRKSKRVPYSETVVVNDSLEVHCNDISEGGLFVHMDKALMPGNVVTVKFPETPLKFEATVQVVPGTGGAGLMFTHMDDRHRDALRELIDAAVESAGKRTETPCVLLAEGSDGLRKMNAEKLAAEGFEVLEAADGMEAIKLLHARRPDVVVLELELARVDGYGVMEFMRSSPTLMDVPVAAISGKVKLEEQAGVLAAGATEFLPKSANPPAKLASIARKLYSKAKSAA